MSATIAYAKPRVACVTGFPIDMSAGVTIMAVIATKSVVSALRYVDISDARDDDADRCSVRDSHYTVKRESSLRGMPVGASMRMIV